MLGVGADRGAEIEHDRLSLAASARCAAIAGPLDPGHGLEVELGHGHQRAGIAGGDGDVRLALLHRVDGEPHRGFPAPLAQRLARLVVHLDGDVGMHERARPALSCGRASSSGSMSSAVAEQQELDIRMARERQAQRPERRPLPRGHPPWRRARCGLCGAWRDNTASAGGHNRGLAISRSLPLRPFFSAASAANGRPESSPGRGGSNTASGLARIGIDAEDEEFGREGAEVDHAVDQRLRRIILQRVDSLPCCLSRRRAGAGGR